MWPAFSLRAFALVVTIAVATVCVTSGEANASACCGSASATGAGRLALWEKAAAGFSSSFSNNLGYWDASGATTTTAGAADRELRFDAWGMYRVLNVWSVFARVPLSVNFRSTEAQSATGAGFGDISVGTRFDLFNFDKTNGLGLGIIASFTFPTGFSPEGATKPLGVDATGRGAFVGSLGLSAEWNPSDPIFLRLDLGASIPIPRYRATLQAWQWLSPTLEPAFTFGYRVAKSWILYAALRSVVQFQTQTKINQSAGHELSLAGGCAWTITNNFALQAEVSSGVFLPNFGQNRAARIGATFGARYGFF